MKTDPQNSDYVVESGATRNFEPWRAEDEGADREKQKRDAEEMGDAMKSLENGTLDSKREMDILTALDEMKSMKSRHATVSVDEMLEALQCTAEEKEKKLEEEDEALIKSIFHGSKDFVQRIHDDDGGDLTQLANDNSESSSDNIKRRKVFEDLSQNPTDSLTKANMFDSSNNKDTVGGSASPKDAKFIFKSSSVRVSVVRKPVLAACSNNPAKPDDNRQEEKGEYNVAKPDKNKQEEENRTTDTSIGLQSLLQSYESDEEL